MSVAPTSPIRIATTASSALTLPATNTTTELPGVGAMTLADVQNGKILAIFMAQGTATGVGFNNATQTLKRDTITDTEWNLDKDIANTSTSANAQRVWSKVLTQNDINSSGGHDYLRAFTSSAFASGSTLRIEMVCLYHPNGWSTVAGTRRIDSINQNTVSVGNNSPMFTPTNSPLPAAIFATFSLGLAVGQSTAFTIGGSDSDELIFGFNGANADISTGSAACQVALALLTGAQSCTNVQVSQGSANTTHANALLQYVPLAPTFVIGMATGASTAFALTHSKTAHIGIAAELDTAPAVAFHTGRQLATAVELDAALPLTHSKRAYIGTATTTDTARPLTASRHATLGTAEEVDAAGALVWTKYAYYRASLTSPAAGHYGDRNLRAYAWCANATDLAEIRFSLYQGATLITAGAWQTLSGTTPTAYAQAITGTVTNYANVEVLVSVRTTSAAVARVGWLELEIVTDISIGTTTTTEIALPITSSRHVTLGTAGETSAGVAVTRSRTAHIGTAAETNAARAVTYSKTAHVGTADEASTGVAITYARTAHIGTALDASSSAGAVTYSKTAHVGTADEADTARAITSHRTFVLGTAVETDIALGIQQILRSGARRVRDHVSTTTRHEDTLTFVSPTATVWDNS